MFSSNSYRTPADEIWIQPLEPSLSAPNYFLHYINLLQNYNATLTSLMNVCIPVHLFSASADKQKEDCFHSASSSQEETFHIQEQLALINKVNITNVRVKAGSASWDTFIFYQRFHRLDWIRKLWNFSPTYLTAVTAFLPHPIVQLQTCFFCDSELIVGGIPHVCFLVIQGKQIMAQRRDC